MLVYLMSLSKLTMSGAPTPAAPPSELPGGDGPDRLTAVSPASVRQQVRSPSLPESHRTIPILPGASFFRKMLAFAGPGYLVTVGYMDPGNWATDLGGGSQFGYTLLSAVLISSLMAIFLQALSAKLGIATGRDLAQVCREHYSRRAGIALWVLCEIAIAACEVAEVLRNREMLYFAIGILGATVMPHNLYLHSSLVQTRAFKESAQGKREAIRFATLDSTLALGFSLFINAAILVLGAAAFHQRGMTTVADISQAYQLLTPVLGASLASTLFAAALLCSGQNSTLTGTLAGQIVMEGFLDLRLKPWLRRLITRSLAIIPAALVIGIMGEGHVTSLLILSQVVLSFQLPFAVVPLIQFTGDRSKMGEFTNGRITAVVGWTMAAAIIVLNAVLLWLILGGKN